MGEREGMYWFDWSAFSENDFVGYCANVENGAYEMEIVPFDYVGHVWCGRISFDFEMCCEAEELRIVMYVGGAEYVNDSEADGWSEVNRIKYPYRRIGDAKYLGDTCIWMTYEKFKKNIEEACVEMIGDKEFRDDSTAPLEELAQKPVIRF